MTGAPCGRDYLIPRTFSLKATFECGQCFRFEQGDDGKWRGVAFGKELCLFEEGETIRFENVSEAQFRALWEDYFDLRFDYDRFWESACHDETLLKIVRDCAPSARDALHLLRQEPFEALCSFLISQNNNIPRIRRIIRTLCENFGEQIGEEFAFPEAKTLAKAEEAQLRALGCGYRAPYLIDAAKKTAEGKLDFAKIQTLPIEKAREALREVAGVGPKVAECVLLYGFHRTQAYPVDVWMRRAAARFFPEEKAPERFGSEAGLAQQYIFAYSRRHPELFRESACG